MERKRRGEEEGEGEVGGKEGERWILLGERGMGKMLASVNTSTDERWVVIPVKKKSEGGIRFLSLCLSCSMVVWRLDMGLAFPLSSFASVGALCFLMNSLCAMFSFSVSFVLDEL